jgi:hypothetical protein
MATTRKPRKSVGKRSTGQRVSERAGAHRKKARPDVTRSEYQLLLAQEEFILCATELIFELMEKTGVTKAELARRVGRTRGYLTQVLDGNRNMTLRTLAELAHALGYRPQLDAVPHSAKRQRAPSR